MIATANFLDARLPVRFWDKCVPVPFAGCWIWIAYTKYGYGKFGRSAAAGPALAHRHSYLHLVGEIPTGLELDHLCRNTHCVNPAHLEPVTFAENQRRRALAIVKCVRGHDYTERNTYRDQYGKRSCLKCRYQAERRRGPR